MSDADPIFFGALAMMAIGFVSGGVLGVVWFCYLVWGAYIYPHM